MIWGYPIQGIRKGELFTCNLILKTDRCGLREIPGKNRYLNTDGGAQNSNI